MTPKLDEIDIAILKTLQEDAGQSVAEIAERVGLTPSPCWRRIKRLETEGVIRRRTAVLDAEKIGLGYTAYIQVKIGPPTLDNHNLFLDAIRSYPEVVEAVTVAGAYDYVITIMLPTIKAHNDFIRDRLLALGIVAEERSFVKLADVKVFDGLPLGHLEGA